MNKSQLRNLSALILGTFLSLSAVAQQKIFEHSLGWRSSSGRVVLNCFAAAQPGQFAVAVSRRDSAKIFLLTDTYKILHEFGIRKNVSEEFSGGFAKDDSIALFFEGSDVMHSWVYNISTGRISEYLIPYDPRKEKHLAVVNTGGRFLHIATKKKEPVLIVYDFNASGNFEKTEYDFSSPELKTNFKSNDLWEALSRSIGTSRQPDVAVINSIELMQPDGVANPAKFYCKNDSLLLVVNNAVNEAKIFSIDLLNKVPSYRKIAVGKHGSSDELVYNSYLYRDRLYYVYADKEGLTVSVNNFYSGAVLASYEAKREDTISFKNTPVTQDGGGTIYSMNAHRELDKTKQLLRKMLAGKPIICVSPNAEGQHEILVGVLKELRQSGGVMSPMGPGGMMMYTGGISGSWQRMTRFKMITDAQTEKHIPEAIPVDLMSKIDNYKRGLKSNDDAEAVLSLNKRNVFMYYEKDTKKLCAVLIGK